MVDIPRKPFTGIYSPFSKATTDMLVQLPATCLGTSTSSISISLSTIIGRRSIKMSSCKNCKPKCFASECFNLDLAKKKSSASMAARDITKKKKTAQKKAVFDWCYLCFVKPCVTLSKGGMIMSVDFASPDIKHLATEMPISPKGRL